MTYELSVDGGIEREHARTINDNNGLILITAMLPEGEGLYLLDNPHLDGRPPRIVTPIAAKIKKFESIAEFEYPELSNFNRRHFSITNVYADEQAIYRLAADMRDDSGLDLNSDEIIQVYLESLENALAKYSGVPLPT